MGRGRRFRLDDQRIASRFNAFELCHRPPGRSMSGIMAIVSLDGRPVPPDLPRAQLAAIAHRGEWEPRLWEAPGIALGHVNLPRTPEAERRIPTSLRRFRAVLDHLGRPAGQPRRTGAQARL